MPLVTTLKAANLRIANADCLPNSSISVAADLRLVAEELAALTVFSKPPAILAPDIPAEPKAADSSLKEVFNFATLPLDWTNTLFIALNLLVIFIIDLLALGSILRLTSAVIPLSSLLMSAMTGRREEV